MNNIDYTENRSFPDWTKTNEHLPCTTIISGLTREQSELFYDLVNYIAENYPQQSTGIRLVHVGFNCEYCSTERKMVKQFIVNFAFQNTNYMLWFRNLVINLTNSKKEYNFKLDLQKAQIEE